MKLSKMLEMLAEARAEVNVWERTARSRMEEIMSLQDAIAQARADGRREGIEEAAAYLRSQARAAAGWPVACGQALITEAAQLNALAAREPASKAGQSH